MPDSDVAIASGRLKARKSVSGSGRRTRNGSTTRRVSACASAGVSSPSTPRTPRSSSAIASAEAGRPSGAWPAPGGSRGPPRPRPAIRSAPAAARSASRAGPRRRCGRRTPAGPASISNRIAPAANRSRAGVDRLAGHLLGRHVARRAHHHAGARQARARRLGDAVQLGPRQAEVEQLHAVRRSGTRWTA